MQRWFDVTLEVRLEGEVEQAGQARRPGTDAGDTRPATGGYGGSPK